MTPTKAKDQEPEKKNTAKAAPVKAARKPHPAKEAEKTPVAAPAAAVAATVAPIAATSAVAPTIEAADAEVEALFENQKSDRYYEAIGRRKTSVARVRLFTKGDRSFKVNQKTFDKYFTAKQFVAVVNAPLEKMNCAGRFTITVQVGGGGINSQAIAIRHGITRALVLFNADFKKRLKKSGYLTRDPRMKERKKPGLKGARRAPQWAKR